MRSTLPAILVAVALLAPPIAEGHEAFAADDQAVGQSATKQQGEATTKVAVDQPESAVEAGALPDDQGTAASKKSSPKKPWVRPPRTSGWAIVWVTAAYTVLTLLQVVAISCQIRSANRSLARLERPWLIVGIKDELHGWVVGSSLAEQGLVDKVPSNIGQEFTVMNHGRSPAWVTRLYARLEPLPKPLPKRPDYGEPLWDTTRTIPPTGFLVDRVGVKLEPEEREAVTASTSSQLALYGAVHYVDVFKRKHVTRFCLILRRSEVWLPPLPNAWFVPDGGKAWNHSS